jgi:hypothetical protein
MPSHRGNRYPAETAGQDLTFLSSALARVQQLSEANTPTMAHQIGFAVGLELASTTASSKSSDVQSELSAVLRKLSLGKVTFREWDPVVFIARTDSKVGDFEDAFSEGVLEGMMRARSKNRVFVKHSQLLCKPQASRGTKPDRRERSHDRNNS